MESGFLKSFMLQAGKTLIPLIHLQQRHSVPIVLLHSVSFTAVLTFCSSDQGNTTDPVINTGVNVHQPATGAPAKSAELLIYK